MPPPNVEKQVLLIEPQVDSKAMAAGMKKAMSVMDKETVRVTKSFKGLRNIYKKSADALTEWSTKRKQQSSAEIAGAKAMITLTEQLAEVEEKLASATEDEAVQLRKDKDDFEKAFKERIATAKDYTKSMLAAQKAIKDLHEEEESRKANKLADIAGYGGGKMGEDLAESFGEALSSIPSRDLMGFAKHLVKSVGTAGKGMQGKGMRMQAASLAGGGMGGGIGKVMDKLGGALSILSKMGPVIGALSGALMAVVKVLLDADAAAKEFNKQVLETTSTASFLSRNFGNADAAAQDLKDTMADMYEQATSLDNLRWGISKETHSAVIAALGAEGVSLKKTADYFKDIKDGAVEATGYVKDWGSMVQMSVGFSRAFGVSLGEITQFQGEMMTEMGQNFTQVEESFQMVADGAQDAGLEAGKFFAQIRAMSSDIGLFNLRMEDATKILGKLDKVMSPRKAQEFFQQIGGFMKGMDVMDRAKLTVQLGTKETKGVAGADLDSRLEGLSHDLSAKGIKIDKTTLKKITKDQKSLTQWMADNDDKLDSATRDQLITAMQQQGKLDRGGLFDVADSLKNLSPMGTKKMLDAMAMKFFKKPMSQLSGLQRLEFKARTNVDSDMIDNMQKFDTSLELAKSSLVKKLGSGDALTKDEVALLGKLGVDTSKSRQDQADFVANQVSAESIFDNMDKSQQDLLTGGAKTLSAAEKQGAITQSISDKLGVIMDYLMGTLSKLFEGIWDDLSSIVHVVSFGRAGSSQDQRDLVKIQAQAARDNAKGLADLAASAPSIEDYKKAVFEGVGKETGKQMIALGGQIDANNAQLTDLQQKLSAAQSDEEKKALQDQLAAASKTRDALGIQLVAIEQAITAQAKGPDKDNGAMILSLVNSIITSGVKVDSVALRRDMGQGMGFGAAMEKQGVSAKDQLKVMEQMRHDLSGQQLTKVIGDLGKIMGAPPPPAGPNESAPAGAPAAAATPSPPPPPPAPAAPASPAQAAAAPAGDKATSPADLQDSTDQQVQQGKDTQNAIDEMRLKLKQQSGGVVLNGSYLKNQYGGQIEDSVYNAASRALFEYWMYQGTNKNDALKALKAGANVRNIGALNLQKMVGGAAAGASMGQVATDAEAKKAGTAHADGGVVARPAPGELFASVKPGETIVPAGGGGGTTKVVIELKGDMLKQIMRATAHDAINDHTRAKKLR